MLSDLLPNYIKNARVLSWEHNAITNSLGGKATGSDRILQHVGALIDELQGNREVSSNVHCEEHSLLGFYFSKCVAMAALEWDGVCLRVTSNK